jgi:hypothetical protein
MIDRRLRLRAISVLLESRHGCRDRRPPLAGTWSHAWPQRNIEAIAALYAEPAVYRSPAFAQPK